MYSMRAWCGVLTASLLAGAVSAADLRVGPDEPLLGRLPPGLYLESSAEIRTVQREAVARKLGCALSRLTNSVVRVHGRSIQINVMTAAREPDAVILEGAIRKLKPAPFCVRRGPLVVEYSGPGIDAALATKTSYELGLNPKPQRVRYRVTAELATVESGDHMACNPLYEQFLALGAGTDPAAASRIGSLAKQFQFGRRLVLREGRHGVESAAHAFQPAPAAAAETGAAVIYSFAEPPIRQGIPFVTATLEISVEESGRREAPDQPAAGLTAPTAFWPVAEPAIHRLAQEITRGKSTNGGKAMAILEWLAPGSNLRFSGQTGSRWGTAKVLAQKFGHCWDFSDVFVTLARAAGVPCRQVAGWFYGSSGHVWAEFWSPGHGWQQVDPTGGGKLRCGIYHIPYFTSETGEMPIVYLSQPRIEILSTEP